MPEHLFPLATTVLEDKAVLGIVGACEDPGGVEVWAAFSDKARAQPLTLCRIAKAIVGELLSKHGRVQARVACEAHRRWAESLGFVFSCNNVGELRV